MPCVCKQINLGFRKLVSLRSHVCLNILNCHTTGSFDGTNQPHPVYACLNAMNRASDKPCGGGSDDGCDDNDEKCFHGAKWPNVQLRHAGPTSANREAELERPSRVACSNLLAAV